MEGLEDIQTQLSQLKVNTGMMSFRQQPDYQNDYEMGYGGGGGSNWEDPQHYPQDQDQYTRSSRLQPSEYESNRHSNTRTARDLDTGYGTATDGGYNTANDTGMGMIAEDRESYQTPTQQYSARDKNGNQGNSQPQSRNQSPNKTAGNTGSNRNTPQQTPKQTPRQSRNNSPGALSNRSVKSNKSNKANSKQKTDQNTNEEPTNLGDI